MDKVILPINFSKQHHEYFDKLPMNRIEQNESIITIDFFRELFVANREEFNNVVSELSLRGAEFKIEKKSPLFPKYNNILEHDKVIKTDERQDNNDFSKINFSLFNIEYYMKRFKIKSNSFFEGIPLKGFLSLGVEPEKISVLKKEFERCGFKFLTLEEFQNQKINIRKPEISIIEEKEEQALIPNKDQKIKKNKNKKSSIISRIEKNINTITEFVQLNDVVKYEDKLNQFKRYRLETVRDLEKQILSGAIKNLNVSLLSYLESCLKKIYTDDTVISKAVHRYISSLSNIPNIPIENILNPSKHSAILTQAKELGIHSVTDLNNYDTIVSFFSIHSFGAKKKTTVIKKFIEEVNQRIDDKLEFNDYLQEKVFILPLLNMFKNMEYTENKGPYFITIEEGARLLTKINSLSFEANEKLLIEEYKRIEDVLLSKEKVPKEFNLKLQTVLEYYKLTSLLELSKINELSNLKLSEILVDQSIFSYDLEIKLLLKYILKDINDFVFQKENIKELLSNQSDRNIKIFNMRLTGETLEEIANKFDLTRERVRQIDKSIYTKLRRIITSTILDNYELTFYEEGIYKVNSFFDKIFINLLKENDRTNLCFLKRYNSIINKKNIETLNRVNKLFENIKSESYIEEKHLLNELDYMINQDNENLIKTISKNITEIIKKYELFQKGQYIIKNNISDKALFELITINRLNGRIDLGSEKDLYILKEVYSLVKGNEATNNFFTIDKGKVVRKISALLSNNEKFIYSGSNKYRILNSQKIPHKLLNKIALFIETELIEEEFVSPRKIINKFHLEFEKNEFNFSYIYNILKLFFEEKFDFGKGNTMYIFPKGSEKKSTRQLIYNKVKQLGGKASKRQLSEELGLTIASIEQNISKSAVMQSINSIVTVVENLRYILENKELISKMELIGSDQLERRGYISSNIIFNELRFDEKFSVLLNEYEISQDIELMPIIKRIFPDLSGHTKYLYEANNKLETYEVFLGELTSSKRFLKNDFFEAGEKLNYGDSTKNLVLDSAINEQKIIRLDSNYYMDAKEFLIDQKTINLLKEYLEANTKPNIEYLSVQTLKGYRRKLPLLDNSISWTHEIIHYVAIKYLDYNPISITGLQYYEDPLLITKENSQLTYNDIALDKLLEYKGNMHEDNIYAYFKAEGLVNGISNAHRLPKQLYNDMVIEKDEFGIVTINEEI